MSFLPNFPALVPGIMPPSRETWQLVQTLVLYMPLGASVQWLTSWYPAGKTSYESRLNLPGRFGWCSMEAVGILVIGYMAKTLPLEAGIDGGFAGLPGPNKLLLGLFVIHYVQRAFGTALLESVYGADPHCSLGYGDRLQHPQCHAARWLDLRLRPDYSSRMAWQHRPGSHWSHGILHRLLRQHLPR